MNKLLWFVVMLMICFLSTARGSEDSVVKICYVPFGVETYVPMTVSNIDSHCSYIGELDVHDKKYLTMLSLFKKAALGSFKDGFVRVKIGAPGSDYVYIDNYGGVKIGETQYHLDPADLLKVKKFLEKVTSR